MPGPKARGNSSLVSLRGPKARGNPLRFQTCHFTTLRDGSQDRSVFLTFRK